MIRAAALLTTLALTATACTLYIGDGDDDHGPWQPYYPDAAGEQIDAEPYYPDAWPADAGLPQLDAQPIPQDACGVP